MNKWQEEHLFGLNLRTGMWKTSIRESKSREINYNEVLNVCDLPMANIWLGFVSMALGRRLWLFTMLWKQWPIFFKYMDFMLLDFPKQVLISHIAHNSSVNWMGLNVMCRIIDRGRSKYMPRTILLFWCFSFGNPGNNDFLKIRFSCVTHGQFIFNPNQLQEFPIRENQLLRHGYGYGIFQYFSGEKRTLQGLKWRAMSLQR